MEAVAAARRRRDICALALCVAVAVALRLPFIGSIGPDEGGYAYVARQWARGATLYKSAWVDRPQGLLLAYRLLLSLSSSAIVIRIGAIVAAVLIVLLLYVIAADLGGARAGIAAAVLYAIIGVGPHIEGFTLNGELVAALPATAAVACAVRATRSERRGLWLVAAGLAGGAAIVTKQSSFDGLTVALAVALGSAGRLRRVGLVLAGAALPLGVSFAAGVRDGWSAYSSALAGWQLRARGSELPLVARFDALRASAGAPVRDLLLIALVAVGGLALCRRQGRRIPTVPLVWLLAAALGVNVGGLYWPHYYVQLIGPLVLLAALALAALPRWAAIPVLLITTAPTLLFVGALVRSGDHHADSVVRYARAYDNDQRIATWIRHHTPPNDPLYVLYSRADIYFLADRRAAFPYLWDHPLDSIPHALQRLGSLLAGRHAPRYVVEAQRPGRVLGGRLARALARDYRVVWRSPGWYTPVLERRPVRGGA